MKKLLRWLIAHTTHRPVWRVTYGDGARTYCLPKSEADGLAETFNGKAWIDYGCNNF